MWKKCGIVYGSKVLTFYQLNIYTFLIYNIQIRRVIHKYCTHVDNVINIKVENYGINRAF